mgnify:FL=1
MVGKIFRQHKELNTHCYDERNRSKELVLNLRKQQDELYTMRSQLSIDDQDYEQKHEKYTKQIENILKDIKESKKSISNTKEFICNLISKEFIIFVIGGTSFVFAIAYGATQLRENALKQQYDTSKLSIQAQKSVAKLASGSSKSSTGIKRGASKVNSRFTKTKPKSNRFASKNSSSLPVSKIKNLEALKAEKFQHIKNIYDSRAEGSIWFFFINAILYVVGIILGYFSYTSNRQYEAAEENLNKKRTQIKKLREELKKSEEKLAKYNKLDEVTKFKTEYFSLLQKLDNNIQDIRYKANDTLEDILSNYNKFIQLQLLNDENTDVTHEYAEELYNKKIDTLRNNHNEGIFKYINYKEKNYSTVDTWDNMITKFQKEYSKGSSNENII